MLCHFRKFGFYFIFCFLWWFFVFSLFRNSNLWSRKPFLSAIYTKRDIVLLFPIWTTLYMFSSYFLLKALVHFIFLSSHIGYNVTVVSGFCTWVYSVSRIHSSPLELHKGEAEFWCHWTRRFVSYLISSVNTIQSNNLFSVKSNFYFSPFRNPSRILSIWIFLTLEARRQSRRCKVFTFLQIR